MNEKKVQGTIGETTAPVEATGTVLIVGFFGTCGVSRESVFTEDRKCNNTTPSEE